MRKLKLIPSAAGVLLFLVLASATVPLAFGQQPIARTQPGGPIRATNATLNGMAMTKGSSTVAWFEWGLDDQYGSLTDPVSIGSGTNVVRVSIPVANLLNGAVYHYRLVASNAFGIARGFDQRFTTGMRVQNWGSFSQGRPVVPTGLTNLVGVAAGHGHCLAVRNDGTVVAWMDVGSFWYPNYGQTNVPAGLSNVVAVAGGYSHSLALKEDGTVIGWGKYWDGNAVNVPEGLTNVIAIGGGDYHSVALKADGMVVAWGGNSAHQTNVPSNLRNVVAISCGSSHSLALKADGTVIAWGTEIAAPSTPPISATNAVAIATEGWYNLALRADGTVVDWGDVSSDVPKPTPLTNVVAIATGFGYGEALKTDGTLVAWGRANDATNVPPALSNVVTFAIGDYHCVGLAPVNLPPQCFARSISGGMNQDLIISLSGYDPNGDELSIRMTSLPATGRLFQYTANGRGDLISAPGTLLADRSRVIFVPDPDTYGVACAMFGFAVTDGELESTPVSWTISIVPAPVIQPPVILNGPTKAVALSFTGLADASFSVLRSTTLDSWTFLGRPTQTAPGQFLFLDYTITNASVRFYRIRSP